MVRRQRMSVIKASEKYRLVTNFIGDDGKEYCIAMTIVPKTDIEERELHELFMPKGAKDGDTV